MEALTLFVRAGEEHESNREPLDSSDGLELRETDTATPHVVLQENGDDVREDISL